MRNNQLEVKNILLTLVFLVCFGLVVFGAIGGTDPVGTTKTLQSMGYNNIATSGRRFLVRSEGEFYSTEFTAVSPTGSKVSGVVTKGFFKPSTVRWD